MKKSSGSDISNQDCITIIGPLYDRLLLNMLLRRTPCLTNIWNQWTMVFQICSSVLVLFILTSCSELEPRHPRHEAINSLVDLVMTREDHGEVRETL